MARLDDSAVVGKVEPPLLVPELLVVLFELFELFFFELVELRRVLAVACVVEPPDDCCWFTPLISVLAAILASA